MHQQIDVEPIVEAPHNTSTISTKSHNNTETRLERPLDWTSIVAVIVCLLIIFVITTVPTFTLPSSEGCTHPAFLAIVVVRVEIGNGENSYTNTHFYSYLRFVGNSFLYIHQDIWCVRICRSSPLHSLQQLQLHKEARKYILYNSLFNR